MGNERVLIQCTCDWDERVLPERIKEAKRNHYEWAAENSTEYNHEVDVVGEV